MYDYFRVLRVAKELELRGFTFRLRKGFCVLLVPKRMLEEAGFREGDRAIVLWRADVDEKSGSIVGADIVIAKLRGGEMIEGAEQE